MSATYDAFVCSLTGKVVDLNDLSTYPTEWLNLTMVEMHMMVWSKLGRSLFYMQFFHSDIDFGEQTERIRYPLPVLR